MSWFIYSLISLFSFVIYDIIGRYFATKSESPRAFAAIINFFMALAAPVIFLIDPTPPQSLTPIQIGLTIFGLIMWALMGRFEYFAKKHVEASVFAITIKIAPVMSFILGVLLLNESFTLSKVVGIVLIIIANTLLYVRQKKGSVISSEGIKYITIMILILSIAWILDAVNVKNWGVATFSILSYLAPAMLSELVPPLKWEEIKKELELTPWWQIAILGLVGLLGYATMLKAFTLGEVSKVVPIATSTTPFIVLLGVLFLGERTHLTRKIVASLMTVIAIYLMR